MNNVLSQFSQIRELWLDWICPLIVAFGLALNSIGGWKKRPIMPSVRSWCDAPLRVVTDPSLDTARLLVIFRC